MDDGSPSLEVGFAIDMGGSFDALAQLQRVMDSTEAKVVREAASIERATSGMINTAPAVARMQSFANAASRAEQDLRRERTQTERQAEALIRQLDRQTASLGKTRDQMQAAKVETVALTAAELGLTDAADRLLASARQRQAAADAVAQAETEAAQRAAAASEAQAQALRSASLAHQMFEARVKQGVAAMREAEAAARAAAAAEKQLATEAAQVRAALDPMFAAQQRFDAELERADRLLAAGILREREYAQEVQRARDALYTHARAVAGAGTEQDAFAGAARRSTFALQQFAIQMPDIVQGLLTGQRPFQVLIQQGGQISQIAMMAEGGVKGFASSLVGLAARIPAAAVGVGAVSAAVLVGVAAWYSYTDAVDKAGALAMGAGRVIGLSADDIQAQAEAASNLATISVGSAREIVTGYVQMGGIGRDVLGGLAALTVDFAAATGGDAKDATEELGRAFQDPVRGADELTERYGVLTQAQAEHIKDLVEQNDLYGAQRALLDDLGPAFAGAAEHANLLARAWNAIKVEAADAWNWLGKAIDRAAGGGTIAERIGDLQRERGRAASFGVSDLSNFDKQIADLQRQLQQQNNAGARSRAVGTMKLIDGIVSEDDVGDLRQRLGAVNKLLADNGKAAGLTSDQVGRARQAQEMLTHAVTTFLPAAEKQVRISQLDAQIAGAKTPAQRQALTVQRELIDQSGKLISSADAQSVATSKGAKAYTEANRAVESAAKSAAKTAANHAAQLAREASAMVASADGALRLARAYLEGGDAAIRAEAARKALTDASRRGTDAAAQEQRQLAINVGEQLAASARSLSQLREETAARSAVNAQVAAGTLPVEQMSQALSDEAALRPLLKLQTLAQGDALKLLTEIIKDYRTALGDAHVEEAKGVAATATSAAGDRLAELREEGRLIGANAEASARAMAEFKALQETKTWTGVSQGEIDRYVHLQGDVAVQTVRNAKAQDAYNDSLTETADRWDIIASKVQTAGQGMADAFGNAGRALGDLVSIYANFHASRTRLDQQHDAAIKAADGDQGRIARENQMYALRSAGAQVAAFGDAAAAAKQFFHEGSAGYQTLQKAEQAFRAVQFALSVRAMAQDVVETGSKLATSAARTAAGAVEAVVNAIKSLPFPFNLVAGAATIGALAGIGVSVAGSFGGSGSKPGPSNDGSGTVLGDPKAQSESIKRSIDALKQVDLLTNSYSREMAASLRSIDDQIGGVAAQIVRGGDLAAGADVSEGFKTNAIGSILKIAVPIFGSALASLFGTKTEVTASGLYGGAQSLGSILAGGVDLSSYSDITKTKKLFGITTGHSYSTQFGDVDPALGSQFTLILRSFDEAIAAAAGPLGVSTNDIQNRLNNFVFDLGKIDFTGLSGTEIQAKLENVLGAAADKMAAAAFPGFERFQRAGEGMFETLVRVSSTVEQVSSSLDLLGTSARGLSIDAKLGLADQFDSVSDLASAADAYFKSYYTSAEQATARTAQMAGVFNTLGLSLPSTLAGFRHLVEAQDLTTAAGQATYATLLQLAPAFADLQSSLEGAKSAADIASERADLQRQLYELAGNTAAIRALDLAKLDESNRALQQQIYIIQDAQAAAKAADDLRQAWTSVGDSIMDEVKRIRGLTDPTGDGSFATLMGQFNAATTAARAGDQDAAKNLPGLSQALLKAAADAATSRQELDRVQAQTAASLEATFNAIGALAINPAATNASLLDAAATTQQASNSPASANEDVATELRALRDEVAQLRSDNNAGHAATASNTGRTAKKLDDVTAASGGDAISVAYAA